MNPDRYVWTDNDIEVTSPTPSKVELSDNQWFRPLTPAEKRINFASVDQTINELEARFATSLQSTYSAIKEDAISRLTTLLENGDLSALAAFELTQTKPYANIIVQTMREAYDYAKKGAADELKVPSPATKREVAALFSQNAQAVVQKQMADMLFAINAEVISEVRKTGLTDMSIPNVLQAASGAMDDFYKNQMLIGGTAAVAIAINRGRGDVFAGYHDQIAVYQYSAILDRKTCPICRSLDKSVVDYATYRGTQWQPPIHFHCRCIFVAVKKDQTEIPSVTGFPKSPGGVDEPSL